MSILRISATLVLGLGLLAGCAEATSDEVSPSTDSAIINPSLPLDAQLEEAIRLGDKEHVQGVLKDFADLDADLAIGLPPLHYAIQTDQPDIVSMLIEAGASIEARDVQGRTPLIVASSFAGAAVMQLLLDAGVDIAAINPVATDASAWHYAAHNGNVVALGILLDEGVDINSVEASGWTALHYAAHTGRMEAVEFLIAHGIDVNIRDLVNSTARGWAEYEGHSDIAEVIAAAGGEA